MESDDLRMPEPVCLDCGGPLGAGRIDRKFCSDACKTNYNNQKRKKEREKAENAAEEMSGPDFIRRIQEIQLKNRAILESLCTQEKVGKIRMLDLLGKGFNPKFITSEAEPTKEGHIYRFCFEYGYHHLKEEGLAVIVCRTREVA